MKNLKKLIVCGVLAITTLLATACGETPFAKISTQITNVEGVNVSLNSSLTKKEFTTETDSEARVNAFGTLGELDCITVNVSGTVSRQDCVESATAMDADGERVSVSNNPVDYYTDFFNLYVLIPANATKIDLKDSFPARTIETTNKVENGYYKEDVQWVVGDATNSASSYYVCGNPTTSDGYFYFGFLDDEDEVIKEYFVHIIYDITFTA